MISRPGLGEVSQEIIVAYRDLGHFNDQKVGNRINHICYDGDFNRR